MMRCGSSSRRSARRRRTRSGIPDAMFVLADTLLVFDHRLRRLQVIANAFIDEFSNADDAYAEARGKIAAMVEILNRPLHVPALNGLVKVEPVDARSNTTQEEFEAMVRAGKEFIAAGRHLPVRAQPAL